MCPAQLQIVILTRYSINLECIHGTVEFIDIIYAVSANMKQLNRRWPVSASEPKKMKVPWSYRTLVQGPRWYDTVVETRAPQARTGKSIAWSIFQYEQISSANCRDKMPSNYRENDPHAVRLELYELRRKRITFYLRAIG